MAFQSAVNARIGAGIPGELAYEGPLRATPAVAVTADPVNNVFGRAFTITTVPTTSIEEGLRVSAGGTGVFLGILSNPKEHVTASEGWDYEFSLPNGVVASFVDMGMLFVKLTNAAQPGQGVAFDNATGELSAIAAGTAPAAGSTVIHGAQVIRYAGSTTAPFDGLAVIQLTSGVAPVAPAP